MTQIDLVINVVCRYYNISREDLTSNTKVRKVVDARKLAIYLLHKFLYVDVHPIALEFNVSQQCVRQVARCDEKQWGTIGKQIKRRVWLEYELMKKGW